jgi:hypothetical protein
LHLIPNQNLDTININNDGFRGKEIQTPLVTVPFGFFLVGGSSPFGVGSASDYSSFPGVFLLMVSSLADASRLDVVYAGLPLACSFTEIVLMHHELLHYPPSFIFVYDGWSDVRRPFHGCVWGVGGSSCGRFLQLFISIVFYTTAGVVLGGVININHQDSFSNFDSNMIYQLVDLWKTNWNNLCVKMENKNIDVFLTLPPLVGTGNKIMTPEEEFPFTKNDHITMLQSYDQYSKSLLYLDKCSPALDLPPQKMLMMTLSFTMVVKKVIMEIKLCKKTIGGILE